MKPVFLSLFAAATLAACDDMGANYTPILDGPQTAAFQSDLAACQTLAKSQRQFDHETMAAATMGMGAGALIGALDDDHDPLGGAIGGAVAGALTGGVASAVSVSDRRQSIVIECLRGRGYRVVG
ncbi:glycine zipper family protein [Maritimibacter sp. UBA3975]|uniref:glycine zipper family protein n=1 Tax=Maritimibacter sp. UBA3975 TaxID=1946833 RepID=UPI000C0BAE99|nr:glycine zipper family protein [Maritimibacter sp. UBA3975]MAM62209.1 glycine zipper family protein [Maritimibacter sp.]|tara:strand:+ start:44102 stop:44476 length:375 start_codon:yes stop_codon:yes gene_type:complete